VPPGKFGHARALAAARRAGRAYITDRDGANPYDRLPSAASRQAPPLPRRSWRGLTPFGRGAP
jgi:hypothetical protein